MNPPHLTYSCGCSYPAKETHYVDYHCATCRRELWERTQPPAPTSAAPTREPIEGRDWICTGNYDGNTCGSDADSGL